MGTAAVVALGLVALRPAGAAWGIGFPGEAPVACSFELHDTATPGWRLTPSRGTASAVGTMACNGDIKGAQLTGQPGPFTARYLYDPLAAPGGNTCALAGGRGIWEVHLPTVGGGVLDLTGSYAWEGMAVGRMYGDLGRLPVTLGYVAYPDPGHPDENCLTKAASHFGLLGQGTIGFLSTDVRRQPASSGTTAVATSSTRAAASNRRLTPKRAIGG
jgi:hypothetical protein